MSKSKTSSHTSQSIINLSTILNARKEALDADLKYVADNLIAETAEQFGEYPTQAVRAFIDVLMRGGKRIRGSLAIETYKMFGGKEQDVIIRAACALEMLNTYMLVADDIQDRSLTRRGGKTAHIQLKEFHEKNHLKGDSQHFGEATAISSFLIAQHYATNLLVNLPINDSVKVTILNNINKCFVITGHGQTLDIFCEAIQDVSEQDIYNILSWKTAYYTFINPLQLGALLAGATEQQIVPLAEYGLNAGRVFQLTDDIIGTFGEESETGKSPLDDIKEGKRTMLIVKALKNASDSDAYFLHSCLGNQDITISEFNRCKKIIINSGALEDTKQAASEAAKTAIKIVESNGEWPESSQNFFKDLVNYLLIRKS
ncbi:MAG: polyprenyl synthetase family protein [Patescibacteria group bacterium]|jgi:geranylgeranyl diphosphate synthase type I|nr:polyprenyl synthetase family protein [Patescibacteria group bacterium]